MNSAHFDQLIGQEEAKRHLKILAQESKLNLGYVPPMLISSPRGTGKTEIAKRFGRLLLDEKGGERPVRIINCASIKSVTQFMDQLYPVLLKLGSCAIVMDECHHMPKELQVLLLTPLNPEKGKRLSVAHKGVDYEFDLHNWAFIFATTDVQTMNKPLVDRLKKIALKSYNVSELGQILNFHLPDITFEDNVIPDIASTLRGNARSAVLRANEIQGYCDRKQKDNFGPKDWDKLKWELGILPFGLDQNEAEVLKIVGRGPCSLGNIVAATSHSRPMVQGQIEPALIKCGLMKIEAQSMRNLTPLGRQVLPMLS